MEFSSLTRPRRWSEIRYRLSHYRYIAFWLLAVISLLLSWWM